MLDLSPEQIYDKLWAESCKYKLVRTVPEAKALLRGISEAALDFETTAFFPYVGELSSGKEEGRVRITSICNDDVHFIIDHDLINWPFNTAVAWLLKQTWYVYNAKFETRWFDYADPAERAKIRDVDFMAKAVIGGHPSSLAKMAKRDLNIDLDKDEQASDWGREALTTSQYNYAAFDSFVTWKIKKHWAAKMNEGHWNGFAVFNDAVRATMEAEETGLFLDSSLHQQTVKVWKTKHDQFLRYFQMYTPPNVIENPQSKKQMSDFLKRELDPSVIKEWPQTAGRKNDKTGTSKQLQLEQDYLKKIAKRLPYPMNRWMASYVGMNYYAKYLSTYGDKLLTNQQLKGKITSRFNIAQAATGRYSSSSDNLQNIPRKPLVRKAFHARPGHDEVMCLADYSGIEVRVLAELSNDEQLRHDTIYGNVHAAGASAINGLPLDYILEVLHDETHPDYYRIKSLRTKAKVFTFRLTYGAGIGALAESLKVSHDKAQDALIAWSARYPKAYAYRQKMFDIMMQTKHLPVCDGRTIYVRRDERTLPVAANYPIQGAAASVMYRAMYHVRRLFVEREIDCAIAATVHDELLSYAGKADAERAMQAQLEGMELGWLDIFPGTDTHNLCEHAIGTTWAAKP